MPYNVRGCVGKRKGKFIKVSEKKKIEAFLLVRNQKREDEIEDVQNFNILLEGRRIMKLSTIAQDLWCKPCNSPISMRNCTGEKRQGLASIFQVECHQCSKVIDVRSDSSSTKYYPDVNLKNAVGMYDSGQGEKGINNCLSAMNIPVVGTNAMKRYERQVGPAIMDLAEQTCRESIDLEIKLTEEYNKTM